jgi:hypothetical protein
MVRVLHIAKFLAETKCAVKNPDSGRRNGRMHHQKMEGLGRRAPGAGMQGAGGRPFAPIISTPVL